MNSTVVDLADLLRRHCPEVMDLISADTDEELDAVIDSRLEKGIAHLEQSKKDFNGLGENGLSAALLPSLWGGGLVATRETNSNGHVDITIELVLSRPIRRFLLEAKIYGGPDYHLEGLEQLLGRYTTGREGRGILIVYFKVANIERKMRGIRDVMDDRLPLQQRGPTTDHKIPWAFESTHGHSCGRDCRVGHFGCNLYIGP